MAETTIPAVISLDTDAQLVHFYTLSAGGKENHIIGNYRACPFDEEFYSKLDKLLKAYKQKNPTPAITKASVILPDHVFVIDTFSIPNLGRKALDHSLSLAIETIYNDKGEINYRTFSLALNKQVATFGIVGVRREVLRRINQIFSNNEISVQNITFAANSMVDGAFAVNQKLKNSTFMLLDIKEESSKFAFVNKGKTIGYFRLPFGHSMLYKSRVASEDLLFDHSTGELLVLNAKEKAKAKQLTMMGEEIITDPDVLDALSNESDQTSVFDTDVSFSSRKAARKLPKFMLRETPTDREDFIYENFRIFVKWTLELIAANKDITDVGAIENVYVNMPSEYAFLFNKVNAESKENKVKFLPLVTDKQSEEKAKNLELFGGAYVKQFNTTNNF